MFCTVWPWNLMDDLGKQALCIISCPLVNSNLSYSPETVNSGQNRRFFEPCDPEILRMTLKNNRASLLCYFKLCASFRTHWWIQIGVTVRKRPIWVKFDDFYSQSEGFESCDWPIVRKRPILGQNRWCFVPCDLEIWWMTLENDRVSLLCCFKLCATFHSHWWIQTGVTVRKRPVWVKFDDF